jgi:cell division protein ZapA (FtsZ GTPase activity inhibitor)
LRPDDDPVREPSEALKVLLFGREYNVRGHGDRKYVDELVDFIKAKANEISRNTRVVTTLDVVVLTLLTVTDEMFQLRQARQETVEALEEKTERLLKTMDKVI